MDDIPHILRRAVGSFDPDVGEGFDTTVRRGSRHRLGRQLLTGATALAVSGALFGSLWMVYEPGSGSRPGAPTPGPSSSPAVREEPVIPPLGKAACDHPQWADSEICSGRSGPVVLLGSGEHDGQSWTLSAFRAVYDGPAPEARPMHQAKRVVRGAICMSFSHFEPGEYFCEGSLEQGSSWGVGVGYREDYDEPLAPDPGDDPFRFGRGGIHLRSSPHGDAMMGTTEPETARVIGHVDDGPPVEVKLIRGNPQQLGTPAKWWVAFFPVGAGRVDVIAEDEEGRELWRQEYRLTQRLFVERVGEGTGVVKGYWSYGLENPGPHPSRPEIDCGTDCWYGFVPDRAESAFTLIAEPEDGSLFAGWKGPCAGQGATCEIEMLDTQTVTAIFEPAS